MIRRSFPVLYALIASVALALSACGFQLRGEQHYAFQRLAIVGAPPPVAARLTRLVQGGSDAKVVGAVADADADAVLHVSETRSWSTLTMNTLGEVVEYQMNYALNYSLTTPSGTLLIAPSSIALNRAMTYSDQYSTAKIAESDLLFADMQNDAVDQLVRRLSVLHSLHETVPGVAPRAPLPPPPL